ncbi:hypothetical protein HHI36_004546 [Cryptolaemus montrouzieri]|uniref:Craniofacial development protein 2-like n=1 Tax=Cryptolaemus montrouzieri TaxID=559131 RepID=A0ABD2NRU3_9CUCU
MGDFNAQVGGSESQPNLARPYNMTLTMVMAINLPNSYPGKTLSFQNSDRKTSHRSIIKKVEANKVGHRLVEERQHGTQNLPGGFRAKAELDTEQHHRREVAENPTSSMLQKIPQGEEKKEHNGIWFVEECR